MKTKLSFANKKRLLLLFVLQLGPFLFEVHPPGNFSGYGPGALGVLSFWSSGTNSFTLNPLFPEPQNDTFTSIKLYEYLSEL